MNVKKIEVKKVIFLCLAIGSGLFSCKSVQAQNTGISAPETGRISSTDRFQVFRRKVLSYKMVDTNQEFANDIDYVEIQWSRESVNWLEEFLAKNKENMDADEINYIENQNDALRGIGLENLWSLTITFKYKDDPEDGILKLSHGYNSFDGHGSSLNDSVEWNLFPPSDYGMSMLQFSNYSFSRIPWYSYESGNTWKAHFFKINPLILSNRNKTITYEPSFPEKGKNILEITSYDFGLNIELSIIIELDGSFFPD